jgi:hypothetical protein
MEHGVLT